VADGDGDGESTWPHCLKCQPRTRHPRTRQGCEGCYQIHAVCGCSLGLDTASLSTGAETASSLQRAILCRYSGFRFCDESGSHRKIGPRKGKGRATFLDIENEMQRCPPCCCRCRMRGSGGYTSQDERPHLTLSGGNSDHVLEREAFPSSSNELAGVRSQVCLVRFICLAWT
jgi:hypothetical protein